MGGWQVSGYPVWERQDEARIVLEKADARSVETNLSSALAFRTAVSQRTVELGRYNYQVTYHPGAPREPATFPLGGNGKVDWLVVLFFAQCGRELGIQDVRGLSMLCR